MFSTVYQAILTQPLLNLLVFLYDLLWHDMGLAIIAVTVIIRLILYPSFKHQLQSQKRLSELQPKLKEIQEKHKNDREQQSKALMEFYKENKVNPFGSCLPLIIQLAILIALFNVFQTGLNGNDVANHLYSFVANPGQIKTISFGFFDLAHPNGYLAAVTGVLQYFQSKLMMAFQPKPQPGTAGSDMAQIMSKQMLYFFPVLTFIFGLQLPAGLALYWLVTTLFAIGQQYVIMKDTKPQAMATT